MRISLIESILTLKSKCTFEEDIASRYDLTPREAACIHELGRYPGLTPCELSKHMALSPSRGSRIIGTLLEKGYIVSEPVPGDRRSVVLSLSLKGDACYKALEKERALCEKKLRDKLTEEQAHSIQTSIDTLISLIE